MTAEPIRIEHRVLGEIRASEDEVLEFPGLPGFSQARRFVVREHDRESAFGWLVSLDVPDLAFPVTDPQLFVPDYAPKIEPHHLRAVEQREGDAMKLLVIARVSEGTVDLNLAAPLLIDLRSRRGLQVILEKGDYAARTRVIGADARSSPEGEASADEPSKGEDPRSSRSPRGRGAKAKSSRPPSARPK